jgi:hypothetical protein
MAAALSFAIEVALDDERSELDEVLRRYPCLLVTPTDHGFALQGTFPIIHEQKEVDAFSVRIDFQRKGNVFAAVLAEIGNRIPRTEARHIFGPHGYACLGLPEDLYLQLGGAPLSLNAFLDGPVRSFLLSQAAMELEGRWPFGDRGHGAAGLSEFYEELLGTRDLHVVERYLVLLACSRQHRQWLCPCGSGKKLRRCHPARFASLRSLMLPGLAVRFLERVRITNRRRDTI